MSIFDPAPAPWPSRMLSIFRIVAGVLFVSFGTMKLFNYPPMPPMPPGVPAPVITVMSETWIAGVLEFVGGSLILIGLFTRPIAFILSGEMAVAYFKYHYPVSFFPTTNNGTPAIMFCWFFLYLVFAGAGVWSVDEAIARRRRAGYVSQG